MGPSDGEKLNYIKVMSRKTKREIGRASVAQCGAIWNVTQAAKFTE
jgi:hypothetical protein